MLIHIIMVILIVSGPYIITVSLIVRRFWCLCSSATSRFRAEIVIPPKAASRAPLADSDTRWLSCFATVQMQPLGDESVLRKRL